MSILITVLLAFLTACGGSSQTSTEQVIDPAPEVIDSAPDDNTDTDTTAEYTFSVVSRAENSLMANVTVTTANDSTVVIQFDSVNIPVRQTLSSELGTEHSFTVVGLRANTSYSFSALSTPANGETIASDAQIFTSGAIPSDAPPLNCLPITKIPLVVLPFLQRTSHPRDFMAWIKKANMSGIFMGMIFRCQLRQQ